MAYRSSAISSSNTGGNLTATPAGNAANDYLSGFYSNDNTIAPTAPTNWTQQANLDHGAGQPDVQTIRYYDKVAVGGDSFTWTNTDTSENALICAAHSGRVVSSPTSFITGTINTSANATPITAVATGGTASAGDDLIAYYGTDNTSAAAGAWTYSAASGPATFIKKQDGGSTNFSFISLNTLDAFGGGATGNVSDTITGPTGGTAGWSGVIIAVKALSTSYKPLPRSRPTGKGPLLQAWIQSHVFRQNIGPTIVVQKNPKLTVLLQSRNRGNF